MVLMDVKDDEVELIKKIRSNRTVKKGVMHYAEKS